MDIDTAHKEFDTETIWLNSASMGLPPRRAFDALQASLAAWRAGRGNPQDYDAALAAARSSYAQLVGVDEGAVAVGSQVSPMVGLVASSLPPGAEVLTVTNDFTSVTFPFLAQTDLCVREAPLEALAHAVRPSTAWVSVSAVQSADGRIADLDALAAACARTGTRVLLDVTQAAGWLPVDASRWAVTVCGGYKWLLGPRGTAFLTVAPDVLDELTPTAAGWYAGADPWASIYGSPLRLAQDARRFDVSPAWHCWVGAAPALELLTEVGVPALHTHAVGLAQRFCAATELPVGDSAIISCSADAEVPARLAEAEVIGAVRAGRLRLSFHLSTSTDDVDRAAAVLRGHVTA